MRDITNTSFSYTDMDMKMNMSFFIKIMERMKVHWLCYRRKKVFLYLCQGIWFFY